MTGFAFMTQIQNIQISQFQKNEYWAYLRAENMG